MYTFRNRRFIKHDTPYAPTQTMTKGYSGNRRLLVLYPNAPTSAIRPLELPSNNFLIRQDRKPNMHTPYAHVFECIFVCNTHIHTPTVHMRYPS